MITEKALAKVNLFLDVVSRRSDGFHDVVTLMHTVSLCDDITINAETADETEITLCIDDSDLAADATNLVYRAAKAYLDAAKLNAKIDIRLKKRIPISAGLGGGSSDAAATLRGLNRIFGALDKCELHEISRMLGSDVPFFLFNGAALCYGRGDEIEPIESELNMYLVVAIGTDRISTPAAYARLDRIFFNFDGTVNTGSNGYLDALLQEISVASIPVEMFNIFETNIDEYVESVPKIKAEMKRCGAIAEMMSGSGPSVFGVFNNEELAILARDHLQELGITAVVANFC